MKPALPGAPRHFHLLWDDDIEQLRGIFLIILERSEEIVRHWYKLYVLHFGDARSLSEAEFMRIFEPGLRRNKQALLDANMDLYAAQVIHLGELLAERRVPLEEIIASLHLFEESAQTAFPQNSPTHIYTSFDKLSHVRIILLVSAYFRSNSAAAGERIAALEREAARLNHNARTRFHGLVGGSPVMRRLYTRIEEAGATLEPVLIVGDRGTGKELVARAIHESGAGERGPFVAINCALMPAALIGGELFGYKRQALNSASADYLGLFRAADGGTLFVDEISALSAQTQDEISRVLREGTVRASCTAEQYPVNVRLIASTRRNPQTAVAAAQPRPDLFDRVRHCTIEVPSLRERLEDLAPLVEHFISVFRERSGRPVYGISEEALSALHRFNWPGNVRELAGVIEQAFANSDDHIISYSNLPPLIDAAAATAHDKPRPQPLGTQPHIASFAELERDLIQRALEGVGGNKVQAAKLLKISRKKLYAKMKKFSLE